MIVVDLFFFVWQKCELSVATLTHQRQEITSYVQFFLFNILNIRNPAVGVVKLKFKTIISDHVSVI